MSTVGFDLHRTSGAGKNEIVTEEFYVVGE